MNEIEWNESYSVKNEDIDDQHKAWIAIFNRLHNAVLFYDQKGSKTITTDALKSMLDYTEHHFKFEEEYLREINYPELVGHRRLHKDFTSQIYQDNKDVSHGGLILNTQVIKTIKNWFVFHIKEEDKKYSVYADSKK